MAQTAVAKEIIVHELVPVKGINDDMRHMADIGEEFNRTMEPILRMYNAAMNMTETRMDIIKDEFKYNQTSLKDIVDKYDIEIFLLKC